MANRDYAAMVRNFPQMSAQLSNGETFIGNLDWRPSDVQRGSAMPSYRVPPGPKNTIVRAAENLADNLRPSKVLPSAVGPASDLPLAAQRGELTDERYFITFLGVAAVLGVASAALAIH